MRTLLTKQMVHQHYYPVPWEPLICQKSSVRAVRKTVFSFVMMHCHAKTLSSRKMCLNYWKKSWCNMKMRLPFSCPPSTTSSKASLNVCFFFKNTFLHTIKHAGSLADRGEPPGTVRSWPLNSWLQGRNQSAPWTTWNHSNTPATNHALNHTECYWNRDKQ